MNSEVIQNLASQVVNKLFVDYKAFNPHHFEYTQPILLIGSANTNSGKY